MHHDKFSNKALILWGDQPVEVASDALGQDFRVETRLYAPDILERAPGRFHVLVNGRSLRLRLINRDSDGLVMECNGRRYKVGIKTTLEQLLDKMGVATVNNRGPAKVQAPMPGLVLRVLTQVGAVVAPGDPLIVLESMKMENTLRANGAGTVVEIPVQAGQAVEKGQLLVKFG
ncbi:MAG: biotin/lipoyl-containing protein [Bacteroidota bacterium]|jgi:biotin carboxyl carrier protein